MSGPKADASIADVRNYFVYDPDEGMLRRRRDGRVAGWREASGYLRVRFRRRNYLVHRLAWFWVHGQWPQGELDHRNGQRDDNRMDNLRVLDRVANTQNLSGPHVDSKSGLAGVRASGDRWAAEITAHGKRTWLGRFDTPAEAHAAYLAAKRELHPSWEANRA